MPLLIFSLLLTVGAWIPLAASKTTIEPCFASDTCSALVGYTLYTDLKVSEIAALFSVHPIDVLLINAMNISYPDVENHILPSQLFLKIPTTCSCVDGIRRSRAVSYTTRTSDTLVNISSYVYGGLVSASQISQSNPTAELSETSVIPDGILLSIPLPCMCFNNSDNNLPAIYMSYVVRHDETLHRIADAYHTTVTDLGKVNSLGSPELGDGDIIAIPLPACASNFTSYADDYDLVVPKGSYAVTASDCVQCSCGLQSQNLYCFPASLAVPCSSMQCRNSNLMIGNITAQQSAGGCNVTSCSYSGFVNGSISTMLSTKLQPTCTGPPQFPTLTPPPTVVPQLLSPAPSPSELGGIPPANPGSSSRVPSSGAVLGFPPTGGPTGSVRRSSGACSLTNHLTSFYVMLILGFAVGFLLSVEL